MSLRAHLTPLDLGTVGLSSGITDADLPAWIKLMLSLEMWAGRLEVLPVLVLLYPGTWKLRKRSTRLPQFRGPHSHLEPSRWTSASGRVICIHIG